MEKVAVGKMRILNYVSEDGGTKENVFLGASFLAPPWPRRRFFFSFHFFLNLSPVSRSFGCVKSTHKDKDGT